VFLDILLHDGTGFDILEQLAKRNGKTTSHIVFITAHEEYAIKAFGLARSISCSNPWIPTN
jgi:two-component system LytT family response regulator